MAFQPRAVGEIMVAGLKSFKNVEVSLRILTSNPMWLQQTPRSELDFEFTVLSTLEALFASGLNLTASSSPLEGPALLEGIKSACIERNLSFPVFRALECPNLVFRGGSRVKDSAGVVPSPCWAISCWCRSLQWFFISLSVRPCEERSLHFPVRITYMHSGWT